MIAGAVEALPAGDDAENYVMIKKKETKEEEDEGEKGQEKSG